MKFFNKRKKNCHSEETILKKEAEQKDKDRKKKEKEEVINQKRMDRFERNRSKKRSA